MVGEKSRSVYRRKRKGKPFSGVPKHKKIKQNPLSSVDEAGQSTSSGSCVDSTARAGGYEDSSEEDVKRIEVFDSKGEGYRMIDLNNLSLAFSDVHNCEEGEKTYCTLKLNLCYNK